MCTYYLFKKPQTFTYPQNYDKGVSTLKHESKVKIGLKEVDLEIVDTPQEKAKGLSGKPSISGDEGMLFIFNNKSYPSFWMKDMNFAIDIIWISDDTIVQIDENVPHPSYDQNDKELPLYRPPIAINYVLEVSAGFSKNNGIKVGDRIDLTNLK